MYQPTRVRERGMRRYKSMQQAKSFCVLVQKCTMYSIPADILYQLRLIQYSG